MWHRVGERCPCGHLSVPGPFYAYDPTRKTERTQKEAGGAYLEWLASDEKPDYVNPPVLAESGRTDIQRTEKRTGNKRTRGRSRKWSSEAERLRAYRERSRG